MNAYILTGGKSRRMGTSKAALFLDRVADVARTVFDDVIAIQRHGADALSIRTIFEEPHEDDGVVFGVITALRHAGQKCFVLAVDYALISRDVLTYLRDREGMPVWNGHPQPLCAVWRPELLADLEGRVSARTLDLRTLGAHDMIPEAELRARFPGEPLLNINTPEDLAKAEKLYGEGFLSSR